MRKQPFEVWKSGRAVALARVREMMRGEKRGGEKRRRRGEEEQEEGAHQSGSTNVPRVRENVIKKSSSEKERESSSQGRRV